MQSRLIPALALILGSVCVTAGGCGPELESIAHLAHIRIIGVRKSALMLVQAKRFGCRCCGRT